MKQHKLLVSLLIIFLFMIGITPINAKSFKDTVHDFFSTDVGDKCEKSKDCEEYCSIERGYKGVINGAKDGVVNVVVTISRYKDGGDWVVYTRSDNEHLTNYSEKGKFSSVFSTSDKIQTKYNVYLAGIKEKDLEKKKCPEHFHAAYTPNPTADYSEINKICFDNDNKACDAMKNSNWNLMDREDFTDDDGKKTYVVSENGESISRYEDDRVIILEPPSHSGDGCAGMFGEKVTKDINLVLQIIRYLGPIIIIVLSILDFIKAVSSGDSGNFNDAWKKLLKRLIVALLLFFVVDLLKVIFRIFDIIPAADCIE